MPWGVAVAAIGAYGASQQAGAAKDGARAQRDAADAATAEQRRQYDQTREDQAPWLQAGQGALGQLQALNGGDFSSFKESPDYQFRFNEGMRGLDRSAAAKGGLYGGGHSADLLKYGAGMASQGYGDYYNRLASIAGVGQTTASGLGSLGMGMANQIGNNYQAAGRASAYGSQGQADAWSGFAAGLGGQVNNWYQNNSAKNGGGSGWYLGNNPGKG